MRQREYEFMNVPGMLIRPQALCPLFQQGGLEQCDPLKEGFVAPSTTQNDLGQGAEGVLSWASGIKGCLPVPAG